MHSKRYHDAQREFWNCIVLSPFCFGVSLVLAFTEWRPIMKAELKKEAALKKPH
ncbi:MAG: hypothetical protein VB100_11880 [Angelakisella sp.]|nr:hypothetical protein [Angelakisella sp.]